MRPFYPSALPFSLLRQIISPSSNQTLLWAITAHNNRGFWWLYQRCIWRFPFQKEQIILAQCQTLWDIHKETKGGKTLMSPVSHGKVVCSISSPITRGFSRIPRVWAGGCWCANTCTLYSSSPCVKAAHSCTPLQGVILSGLARERNEKRRWLKPVCQVFPSKASKTPLQSSEGPSHGRNGWVGC